MISSRLIFYGTDQNLMRGHPADLVSRDGRRQPRLAGYLTTHAPPAAATPDTLGFMTLPPAEQDLTQIPGVTLADPDHQEPRWD